VKPVIQPTRYKPIYFVSQSTTWIRPNITLKVLWKTETNICGQRTRLTHASSTIQTSGNYKPRGTLQLSQGNITARILTTGADELGRWTYQTFAGKDNKPVTIITVYQVCQKSTRNQGQYTALSQQESLLRQRGETDYTPRKVFAKI